MIRGGSPSPTALLPPICPVRNRKPKARPPQLRALPTDVQQAAVPISRPGTGRVPRWGVSSYSNVASHHCGGVGAPPSSVSASPVSSSQISRRWIDNSTNETGFRSLLQVPQPSRRGASATERTKPLYCGGTDRIYRYLRICLNSS